MTAVIIGTDYEPIQFVYNTAMIRLPFRRLLFILPVLLAALAVPALAVVEPMGAFARFTGPQDSRDGYEILLWREDDVVMGRLTVWQSGEKQWGDFWKGLIDEKGIYFIVKVPDPVSEKAKPFEMAVKGQVMVDKLEGLLFWQADRAEVGDDDKAEKISLPRVPSLKLRPFKNLSAWKLAAEKGGLTE
jgi:hypothetical protein